MQHLPCSGRCISPSVPSQGLGGKDGVKHFMDLDHLSGTATPALLPMGPPSEAPFPCTTPPAQNPKCKARGAPAVLHEAGASASSTVGTEAVILYL